MSVNKVNKDTGELVTLASGQRMWVGTKAAHTAAIAAGTMPNNCMVCITDDYQTENTDWVEGTHCRARKVNGIVYASVLNSDGITLAAATSVVAILPEGFAPTSEISGAFAVDNQHDCPLNTRIRPDGEVWVWRNPAYSEDSYTSNSIYAYLVFTPDN